MSVLFVGSDKSPAQCFLEFLVPNKCLKYTEQLQLCLGQTGSSRTEVRRATPNVVGWWAALLLGKPLLWHQTYRLLVRFPVQLHKHSARSPLKVTSRSVETDVLFAALQRVFQCLECNRYTGCPFSSTPKNVWPADIATWLSLQSELGPCPSRKESEWWIWCVLDRASLR